MEVHPQDHPKKVSRLLSILHCYPSHTPFMYPCGISLVGYALRCDPQSPRGHGSSVWRRSLTPRVPFTKSKLTLLLRRTYNQEKSNPQNDINKPTKSFVFIWAFGDDRHAEEVFHFFLLSFETTELLRRTPGLIWFQPALQLRSQWLCQFKSNLLK